MLRAVQFTVGFVLLLTIEFLRANIVDNYFHVNIIYFRIIGWLLILFPSVHYIWFGDTLKRVIAIAALLAYIAVFYLFNLR